MNYQRLLPLLVLLFICLNFSCKKSTLSEPPPPPPVICEEFRQSIIRNDINEVKRHITSFINDLSSSQYTAENMDKLAKSISSHCTVSASIYCYNCIKTLPSMTEIIISLNSSVVKAIDISYTASNEMKFVTMHEIQ
jgi:hypothetical protein